MDEPRPPQAEFEAMMRRYVAKLFARYAPVALAMVLLLLVIILVPTTKPASQNNGLASGGAAAGTNGSGNASGTASAGQSPTSPSGTLGGGGLSLGSSGAGGQSSQPSASGGSGPGPAATFVPSGSSAGGVSKTRVTCTAGARQFTWSGHSPYCEPAFTGNNGGATMHGVTASTITLTFRIPSSADNQAINAATGSSNVNYPAMEKDFQTYANFFNSQFELYGRHVVVKFYNGQGDYIQEDEGQDLAGAQADAVTAKEMGGFGDVTFYLGTSQAYEQDIAQQGMEDFSSIGQPASFFQQYAPYEWSINGPTGTDGSTEVAALVCRRLFGMNAAFAGSALYQKEKRVFGLVYPETPNYTNVVNTWEGDMARECGLKVAKTVAYQINVANFETEATQDTAELNAAGVTTVLCACDPVYLIFLTPSASGQGYNPEWFSAYDWGDPAGQEYTQSEWSHAFAPGSATVNPMTTEAYKTFKLADPSGQPAESGSLQPYYSIPYYALLPVFEGLQAAGPDLTPAHFAQGMFSLPPSAGADPQGGQWKFGPNVYDPVDSFGMVWWNAKATSPFNNTAGTYQACNGGAVYTRDNLAALGGPGQQLNCFGH